MTVKESMVVSLNYKLSNHTTGEKIEETSNENPMVFLYGVGGLIPDFEMNIAGKKAGDKFEFSIVADRAYGVASEDNIAMIPVSVFHDEEGKFDTEYFKVDASIPMSDSEGNRMMGTIRDVNDEFIKMDFNHPLSGIDLHFIGEILEIREATEDELAHGHAHGPGGHHH
ncbi:MAG: FKBP-type peptidyl-prolyl cis-trans isomerase [Bacteroidota bacterium]